jgi:hypothetical protein
VHLRKKLRYLLLGLRTLLGLSKSFTIHLTQFDYRSKTKLKLAKETRVDERILNLYHKETSPEYFNEDKEFMESLVK